MFGFFINRKKTNKTGAQHLSRLISDLFSNIDIGKRIEVTMSLSITIWKTDANKDPSDESACCGFVHLFCSSFFSVY